jgi:hypothetical protein
MKNHQCTDMHHSTIIYGFKRKEIGKIMQTAAKELAC